MTGPAPDPRCVFCRIVSGDAPAAVVYSDRDHIAFLDHRPRTRGHLQLVPRKHYRWIHDLPDMGPIFSVAQSIIRVIIPVLGADHVTLGSFGHEVYHAHIWIVPQYAATVRVSETSDSSGTGDDLGVVAQLLRNALTR